MDFDLVLATQVLRRTPATLQALLGGLPAAWTHAAEGPATFSPFDVVGTPDRWRGDRLDTAGAAAAGRGRRGPLRALRSLPPPGAQLRSCSRGSADSVRRSARRQPRDSRLLEPDRCRPRPHRHPPRSRYRHPVPAPRRLGGPRPRPPRPGLPGDGQAVPRGRGPVGRVPAGADRSREAAVVGRGGLRAHGRQPGGSRPSCMLSSTL